MTDLQNSSMNFSIDSHKRVTAIPVNYVSIRCIKRVILGKCLYTHRHFLMKNTELTSKRKKEIRAPISVLMADGNEL
jgi:hypothetical protein